MLATLDDDEEHTWAVVLDDGHGTYYDVLDVTDLYLDLDLDFDAAESVLPEAKTFLDNASSVTRTPSLASSLPGAFLLSRSTSAATMKTSQGVSGARTSSNLNSSFVGGGSDDPRNTRPFHEHDHEDDTPPLPPLPFDAVTVRRIKPSKSLQLDLERGRRRTRRPLDQGEVQHDRHLRLFDQYLLPEQRPMTARSQHSQVQQSPSAKGPVPNAARYIRIASDGASPSIAMTREDFEALPPTIQRKYFSTLERLRFAQDSCLSYRTGPTSSDAEYENPNTRRSDLDSHQASLSGNLSVDSPATGASLQNQPHISTTDLRFYANLPDKIKRRHLTEEEQLVAQRHRQSVILDAADEALIKVSRRQSQLFNLEAEASYLSSQDQQQSIHGHVLDHNQHYDDDDDLEASREMEGSLYESFRWLEEDEELDLRLYLDDYHINLRQEVPMLSKSHRPTFRRHLSVSKLPFGRNSISGSKPSYDKDPPATPIAGEGFSGHVRRKSRALSLMSPSKQSMIDTPPLFDPATAHYQDPEARMKLRVYLASPQKFDEAIEFGFPSIDDVRGVQEPQSRRSKSRQRILDDTDNFCTFLEDGDDEDQDDALSAYTDGFSTNDPDSPRTPDLADKPPTLRPSRLTQEFPTGSRGDYAQAPASSREMTLRMTLTRPDLRANEDQIYGWQRGAVMRKTWMRDGHPPALSINPGLPKQSLEKPPLSVEQNHAGICDSGVVKRIWNRVRRT
ncbi:hypothetical protein HJFPF1_00991 [Paramyrothecium foliicola]|nr:hypothetical protein HJFPF1_00991 [Paramyrothecium foliicola]